MLQREVSSLPELLVVSHLSIIYFACLAPSFIFNHHPPIHPINRSCTQGVMVVADLHDFMISNQGVGASPAIISQKKVLVY